MTTAVETPTPRAQFLAERTRIGTPRLKPYERLMTRFYEVLCLARAFSPARGDRTPPPLDRDEHQARRRRLLRNLAYICDFDKGGAACTAVALEDGETTYTFWIASNATGTPALDMVTAVLQFLAPTPASHDDDDDDARAAELLGMCTEFAAKRIKTERQFLQRTIAQIHKHLSRPGNMKDGDTQLLGWLDSISLEGDPATLCRTAFRAALRPGFMPRLAERHAHQPYFGDRWSPFAIARHYIGRLAHHVVSAEQLVADARGLSGNIFESYNVRMVDRPEPAPARLLDAHVSFPGILGRMFGKDDPRKDEVAEAMLRFDDTSERTALAGFVNVYANCKPVVHAEVQLLEHFYRGGLRFVEGDRYIACSKPACFCCKLYFEHHPAGMVVPQSHQNVWVNWAPPRVDNFQKGDAASDEQRDVMNEMIKVLRRDVVRQVLRISQLPGWHPDSVSGIGGL